MAGDPAAFPEAGCRSNQTSRTITREPASLAAKKDLLLSRCRPRRYLSREGPDYSVKEISKSSKQAYWRMALDSFRSHQTQAKSFLDKVAQMDEAQIEKMATSDSFWTKLCTSC